MMVFANSRCLQLCVVLLAKVNVRWSRLGSQPRVDGDGSDSGGKKRWGWLEIDLKSRGVALAETTWRWVFSCCLPRATEYNSNESRAFCISRHFCTLSRTLSCHEPCLLVTAACLLPPAAAACYICCRCLLCENQARGRLGLKAILKRVLSNQSLAGLVALWSTKPPRFTRGKIPIGVATKGAMSGVTPTLAIRSRLSNMSSFAYFETSDKPLSTPPTLTPAMTMLAHDMQQSFLSHNEFALCLRSLLRPSSALSPCEFATCMRALIPSTVPACLRSLPRPPLALSPSEFESYMRALTPTPVAACFRQSHSRPGQPCWRPRAF